MLGLFLVCISTLRTSCAAASGFYTSALLDLTMLSLASVSFFPSHPHNNPNIFSPSAINSEPKSNSQLFLWQTSDSFSHLSAPPHSVSTTHWTIPSYPALAWENDKKNDKCPRKTAREMVWKWEWGGVAMGESGQAGRKEGERQRKGKEEAGVLNKQNKWKWVRCCIQRGEKAEKSSRWISEILTLLLYIIDNHLWMGTCKTNSYRHEFF